MKKKKHIIAAESLIKNDKKKHYMHNEANAHLYIVASEKQFLLDCNNISSSTILSLNLFPWGVNVNPAREKSLYNWCGRWQGRIIP